MKRWFAVTIVVVLLDQYTKFLAEKHLILGLPQSVIDGFFSLRLAYNPGAAFSFLGDAGGWQRWFFITLALAVSVWLVVWLVKLDRREHLTAAALASILGGALGNAYDRIAPSRAMVVDFLDFHLRGWHWPAFNVADIAICAGAGLLVYLSIQDLRTGGAREG